jgi:hypothetical protein
MAKRAKISPYGTKKTKISPIVAKKPKISSYGTKKPKNSPIGAKKFFLLAIPNENFNFFVSFNLRPDSFFALK